MNTENTTSQNAQGEASEVYRSGEKEGVWEQIQQHFQITLTALAVRLVVEGKTVQQVADVISGIKEAARLFTLHNSPQKAEELISGQENLFNRKCQHWDQVAKSAEARERAVATGGAAGSSSSASNRRKLETAHNHVRNRITNAKQCLRRLRTALNRGVSLENKTVSLENDSSIGEHETTVSENDTSIGKDVHPKPVAEVVKATEAVPEKEAAEPRQVKQSAKLKPVEPEPGPSAKIQNSKFLTCFEALIGNGLRLEYESAPYLDPFCDEGLDSREAVWAGGQPYCLIVQWEDSPSGLLNFKFWIVPSHPDLIDELRSDNLPSLFLHTKHVHAAEKLNFELVVHDSRHSPLTGEMNQLVNRIEAERFLNSKQKTPLYYLTCNLPTKTNFESAVQQPFLLELL